ncbi:MAG TPA: hypothetical protein VHS09_05555 [Polyangiaceae bacterium]|jgi:hypothetical protein|nr:hypothetical protein [Polyangiaceae bacterium]
MDQRVSVRRFVVPVLLAAFSLCGSMTVSSSASAREPAGRVAVTAPHVAPAARTTFSSTPVRSASTRSTTLPTKTVAVHFTPGAKPAPNGSMLAMSKL